MDAIQLLDEPTFIITIKDKGKPVPIQDVILKQIVLKKPDGTVLVKTADFLTSGADAKLKYKALPGEIDQAKAWSIQAVVQWADGRFASHIETCTVKSN
jgi:hypothetical protein